MYKNMPWSKHAINTWYLLYPCRATRRLESLEWPQSDTNLAHLGQIRSRSCSTNQIVDDLDRLDPYLPFWDVVRTESVWDRSSPGNMFYIMQIIVSPTRQHELDRTDEESISPEISRTWSGNEMICPMIYATTWVTLSIDRLICTKQDSV